MDVGNLFSFLLRFIGTTIGLVIGLAIFGAAFNLDDDFADMVFAAFVGVFIYDALLGRR